MNRLNPKPFPRVLKIDLGEIRAVEKAVDSLPYGKFNPAAKEKEEEARAAYRAAKK